MCFNPYLLMKPTCEDAHEFFNSLLRLLEDEELKERAERLLDSEAAIDKLCKTLKITILYIMLYTQCYDTDICILLDVSVCVVCICWENAKPFICLASAVAGAQRGPHGSPQPHLRWPVGLALHLHPQGLRHEQLLLRALPGPLPRDHRGDERSGGHAEALYGAGAFGQAELLEAQGRFR